MIVDGGGISLITASGFVEPATEIRVGASSAGSTWVLLQFGTADSRIDVYARRSDLLRLRDVINVYLAEDAS